MNSKEERRLDLESVDLGNKEQEKVELSTQEVAEYSRIVKERYTAELNAATLLFGEEGNDHAVRHKQRKIVLQYLATPGRKDKSELVRFVTTPFNMKVVQYKKPETLEEQLETSPFLVDEVEEDLAAITKFSDPDKPKDVASTKVHEGKGSNNPN